MKKPSLAIILLLIMYHLHAQKIKSYEYWVDENIAAKVVTTVTPLKTLHLQQDLPLNQVGYGLHIFNIRFADTTNTWSSIISQFFVKNPPTSSDTRQIVAYEYWVDDGYAAKTYQQITPSSQFHLAENLNLNSLSFGLHLLNIRFRDDMGNWSSILNQFFVKNPPTSSDTRQIVAYEYWVDDGFAAKTYQQITPSSQFHLVDNLNLNSVSTGFHVINIRFKDDMGSWSAIQTQFFTKYGTPRIIPNKTVSYRFWFDDDLATQETFNLPLPYANYNLKDTIETPYLTIGSHTFSYQFKDSNQVFGSIRTDTFSITNCHPHGGRAIAGAASVCVGQAGVVYSIRKIKNAFGYTWSVPAGATIISGSNTHSITVDYAFAAVSGEISVFATNPCGNGATMVFPVTVHQLPHPLLSGEDTVCSGTSGWVYSTETGKSAYSWSISPGNTITAGGTSTSPTATVKWNSTGPQWIRVNYTNEFGCRDTTDTQFDVFVKQTPVPAISGLAGMCAGTADVLYTTEPGMTNYSWSISTGGTITMGGTTTSNTIAVTWNTAGARWVKVNYTNAVGCPGLSSTQYNVTVHPLPVPSLNGNSMACVGTSGLVYSTDQGMSGYQWAISPGGAIVGNSQGSSISVNWNETGTQWVRVNYTDGHGCTAVVPTQYNVLIQPLPVPLLAGEDTLCSGTSGWVYATETGKTNYTWSVSPGNTITAGGTATSPTATVKWNSTGSQWIRVNYMNEYGCTAFSASQFDVFVKQTPTPVISGPGSVCIGTVNSVYATQPGMSNYSWAISAGGTIISGGGISDTAITLTWNTTGAKWVKVNYSNTTGCPANTPTQYNVVVNALPNPTLTGGTTACLTTPITYSTQTGMTNYAWVVSPGGTVVNGGTPASYFVTINWTTLGAKTVSVNYTNTNGCTALSSTVKNINVVALPMPVITGPAEACIGSAGNLYSTEAGMTGYTWTISSGGTIVGSTSGSSVTVTWNTVGNRYVRVNYSNANGCRALSATQFNVVVKPVPVPVISGLQTVCQGMTNVIYSTETGMSGYQWIVSTGGTIAGSSAGSSITVNWISAGAQSISVNYAAANGCMAITPTTLTITVNPLPAGAGSITGPAQVIQGQTGATYSIGAIPNATGYAWSLPSGATIVSGNNSASIVVDFSVSAVSGDVSVHGTNACGIGTESPVLNVQVIPTSLLLENVTVGNGQTHCYNAVQTIYVAGNGTTFAVQSGGSATMVAGQNILYRPTTSVASGGYMRGYITTNGQYCGTQAPPLMAVVAGLAETAPFVAGSSFRVYPNPTTGSFTLEQTDGRLMENLNVMIYSMQGKRLLTHEMKAERSHVFSLSNLPPGLYFVHVLSGRKTEIVKVIRQ